MTDSKYKSNGSVLEPLRMPPLRAPNSRFQRHFSPLIVRTVFKPEIFLSPPPIAYRVVYSTGVHVPKEVPGATDPATYTTDPALTIIPKPPGDVTRLKRNGYKLKLEMAKHLKWTEDDYQRCLVSSKFFTCIYL